MPFPNVNTGRLHKRGKIHFVARNDGMTFSACGRASRRSRAYTAPPGQLTCAHCRRMVGLKPVAASTAADIAPELYRSDK